MAITVDPLSVGSMVDVKSGFGGFNNLMDSINSAQNAVQGAIESAKSSVLDKINSVDISLNNLLGSTFTDVVCCKMPGKILMTDVYTKSLDRGFNLGDFSSSGNSGFSMCELAKLKNPFDAAIRLGQMFRSYPGLLQGSMEDRLKYLIKSDLLAKMDILGLGSLLPTCIFGNTINTLAGTSGAIGVNMHDKNELRELMMQNPCANMLANTPLISGWLSKSVSANLINTLIDSKKNGFSLYRSLDSLLLITGQRSSALGGLIASIAYAKDKNVSVKMNALHHVIDNGNLTMSEYNMLKYNSKDLLSKLDEEKSQNEKDATKTSEKIAALIKPGMPIPKPGWLADSVRDIPNNPNPETFVISNPDGSEVTGIPSNIPAGSTIIINGITITKYNPAYRYNISKNPMTVEISITKKQELERLIKLLNVLDPTWKLWDLYGSKVMCDLVQEVLKSRSVDTTNLSTTVTTNLGIEHKIAIACAFKHVDGKKEHKIKKAV